MKTHPATRARRRAGQTTVEYVVALALLLGVVFAFAALAGAFRSNADRSVSLASSEYP